MAEHPYAIEALRKWYENHRKLFEKQSAVTEWREVIGISASLSIETSRYMAEVSAWDYASCLDIFVADLRTSQEQMLHVGDCKSENEFHDLLGSLIFWCNERHQ